MGTGTQFFKLHKGSFKGPGSVVLHLVGGYITWFLLSILLVPILIQVLGSASESPLVGVLIALVVLSGIIIVPLSALVRWLLGTEITIGVDSETGMTVTRKSFRKGSRTHHYKWPNVSSTEMTGETTNKGMSTKYTFHVYTDDGEQLTIPESMNSFAYFVDLMNRATVHLPYTWCDLDYQSASSLGVERGWAQVKRVADSS
jgi:hypothetical protein